MHPERHRRLTTPSSTLYTQHHTPALPRPSCRYPPTPLPTVARRVSPEHSRFAHRRDRGLVHLRTFLPLRAIPHPSPGDCIHDRVALFLVATGRRAVARRRRT